MIEVLSNSFAVRFNTLMIHNLYLFVRPFSFIHTMVFTMTLFTVSAFPFGGIQNDISNNMAPQPIDLSSLEPFPGTTSSCVVDNKQ